MEIPPRVSFRGMPVSDAVEAYCLSEVEKLERYYDRITGCRITIEREGHAQRKGAHWKVHVLLSVPGGEIVIDRDPPAHEADEKLELALREAFDRTRRRLQDYARRQAGRVKRHDTPPTPAEAGE